MSNHDIFTLKEKAKSFLMLVASGEVQEAFKRYIGSNFRHHNPYFPGDAESLKAAMEENAIASPEKRLEVKGVIEEQGRVAVISHIKQNADDPGMAVVHLFRFEEGRIVELWDIGQQVPETSPNENGMF